jgi:hypothetical protein
VQWLSARNQGVSADSGSDGLGSSTERAAGSVDVLILESMFPSSRPPLPLSLKGTAGGEQHRVDGDSFSFLLHSKISIIEVYITVHLGTTGPKPVVMEFWSR